MSGNSSSKFYWKFPEPDGYGQVLDYYKDADRRTPGVYLRDDTVTLNQLTRKLRPVAYDERGDIAFTSALQPLTNSKEINCTAWYRDTRDGFKEEIVGEQGIPVELVGVLKRGKGRNDVQVPSGVWYGPGFGLPMLTFFDRLRTEALPKGTMLITNVQNDLVRTANYVKGAESMNSPMSWEEFVPARQLVEAFEGTAPDDENIHRDKRFYRVSVKNLFKVAKFLLKNSKQGYMINHRGEKVHMDFSGLGLDSLMEDIVAKKWYFDKLLYNYSWEEAKRTFDAGTPGDMPAPRPSRLVTAPPDRTPAMGRRVTQKGSEESGGAERYAS